MIYRFARCKILRGRIHHVLCLTELWGVLIMEASFLCPPFALLRRAQTILKAASMNTLLQKNTSWSPRGDYIMQCVVTFMVNSDAFPYSASDLAGPKISRTSTTFFRVFFSGVGRRVRTDGNTKKPKIGTIKTGVYLTLDSILSNCWPDGPPSCTVGGDSSATRRYFLRSAFQMVDPAGGGFGSNRIEAVDTTSI